MQPQPNTNTAPRSPPRTNTQPIPVVVKSFAPAAVRTPEDFRELLMEAGKLTRLEHP